MNNKKNNTNNLKSYPRQVKAIKRTDITLSIDAWLYLPNEDMPPLEMHNIFSRFALTILNRNNKNEIETVTANIPAEEIFAIKAITNAVISSSMLNKNYLKSLQNNTIENKIQKQEETNDEDFTSKKAFNVKIGNGNLKGKTPGEVLLDNPNNKNLLINQKKWLETNLDRYPRNKDQIDAINEALELLNTGKLSSINNNQKTSIVSNGTNSIDIYRADIRIPNKNKVDENGNTFVYSVLISFDDNNTYPFSIQITNMKAKTNEDEKGMITANLKNAVDKKVKKMSLSMNEWLKIVERMSNTVNNFETVNFVKQYKIAEENSYKHD